jgi:curved DNA binding protein
MVFKNIVLVCMDNIDPLLQLDDENNLNKYKMAGKIVAKVLDELVRMAKPGCTTYDMCVYGDRRIVEEVGKVYTETKFKGISFPTAISINNKAGFDSPVVDKKECIRDGDLVKIELGAHIDGYPATVGFTVLVNESKMDIKDKRADVLRAVAECSKEILKVMVPGRTNRDVTKIMEKYSELYKCSLPYTDGNGYMNAPGIMSYQMSRGVVDGYNDDDDDFIHGLILCRQNDSYDFSMRETQFLENEVWGVDIMVCSGTGKLKRDDSCTIYKRLLDRRADLRLDVSRKSLNELKNNPFPVNIREMVKRNSRFNLGLKECLRMGLVEEYPVLSERRGEYIARIKFTVVVRDKPILVVARSEDNEIKKLSNL